MMRVFELSTRITAVSRAEGRSATAAAAYRACCAILCERENRLHDYTRKRGLEVSRIIAPSGSPAWALDRAALWNAAERRERNGKRGPNAGMFKANAKTAREFMFAFPVELSEGGRLAVAETIARHLAATHGIVADFSIHRPGKDGDERNFHCHMLTTTRRMMPAGLGEKAREWDAFASGSKLSKQLRALLAATMNDALAAEGQAGAVRHAKERAALAARQDRALQQKLNALSAQERRAAAITDSHRQQAAPGKPGVLLRLARIFGRHSGADGDSHPAPAHERPAPADLAAVRSAIQAERTAYIAGQAQERQGLADRHAAEDRQLDAAAAHRKTHDRLTEQQHRREPAQDREQRQQEHGQENDMIRPR